ncbi:hypothetical protein WR25_21893 isoform A [Diploscapter pachys]|uniref:Uncharacterized protein n=1 Tax=Diploscapter pachys TaxID=2018661 RepID=A0A2A2LYP0_9BILA|nr:hypothetical protein WR25_21893 isoform A [Diploscapter pachys]
MQRSASRACRERANPQGRRPPYSSEQSRTTFNRDLFIDCDHRSARLLQLHLQLYRFSPNLFSCLSFSSSPRCICTPHFLFFQSDTNISSLLLRSSSSIIPSPPPTIDLSILCIAGIATSQAVSALPPDSLPLLANQFNRSISSASPEINHPVTQSMACLRKLKEDIALLEALFHKQHTRFQVVNASVDEICMKFIDGSGSSVIINANIQENYPRQPPIWFSESDDVPAIGAALQSLTESATDQPITILHQTHQLITELCDFYQLPIPSELMSLLPPDVEMEKDEGHGSDMESDEIEEEQQDDEEEEGEGEAEEDDDHDLEVVTMDEASGSHEDELPVEGKQVLDQVCRHTRQQHLTGRVQGSVTATDRLMKEIKDIYRSEHFKNGQSI